MSKKRYAIPALILGLALLGGGATAYAAFTPGTLPSEVLTKFTTDQQAAIQKAQDIRSTADAEAKAVLDAAGVSEDALHSAMDSFLKEQHTKMDAALDANDYAAFEAAVAGSPMADKLTQDIFTKLVQIRSLEKSGDHAGAMKLRQELGADGFMGGPGGHGHGGPMGRPMGIPPQTTTN